MQAMRCFEEAGIFTESKIISMIMKALSSSRRIYVRALIEKSRIELENRARQIGTERLIQKWRPGTKAHPLALLGEAGGSRWILLDSRKAFRKRISNSEIPKLTQIKVHTWMMPLDTYKKIEFL